MVWRAWSDEEIEQLKTMIAHNIAFEVIARRLSRSVDSIKGMCHRLKLYRREGTLCWYCKRAAAPVKYQCEWAYAFRPVPGWDAEPARVMGDEQMLDTYHVYSCPKYKEDNEEW